MASNPGATIAAPRLRRVSRLALPLIAGAMATNLVTIVDTLMVAQLGDRALAGVGIAGQMIFLFLTIALGLGAGVQAMVARRVGENRVSETGLVLNAGLLMAVVTGALMVIVSYAVMPVIFGALSEDALVVEAGWAYLATRIPSILFIATNVVFRSYWVGVSRAKWSMVSIVAVSLANVVFNYMLIFGNLGAPELGVAGAGLGSTLAVLVGLLANAAFAMKLARANGFLKGLPAAEHTRTIVRISYPESLRQALFSLGVLTMYVLIGKIGTTEIAVFHVVISVCMLAYMPHIGIGGAATTLVGEAMGRKDSEDAKAWGWYVSSVGLATLLAVAAVIAVYPQPVLKLFFADAAAVTFAALPLQIALLAHVLDGYGKVLGSALIGAGATPSAMRLTVLPQWLLLLPALAIAVLSGHGLVAAMLIFCASTAIAALFSACTWQRGTWLHTAV